MSTFYNSLGQPTNLSSRIGAGAEGEVFNVEGRDDVAAKIYIHRPDTNKIEKLNTLSSIGNDRLYKIAAWPLELILDSEGVVGFLMKKQPKSAEVHSLHSPRSRLKKFPRATWQFLIHTATNLARAVSVIHQHDIVIGDINPKNILVTNRATIHLLDCDSFQLKINGNVYRCESGFPEYTAPELHGTSFGDIDRTVEHDYFGLAVSIFQLLFIGRHPYAGRNLSGIDQSLVEAISAGCFVYGKNAENLGVLQPPGSLSLNALPDELSNLFNRAFLSINGDSRPTPQEWVEQLDALSAALMTCNEHDGHVYYAHIRNCPWCVIEQNSGTRLFYFADDALLAHSENFNLPVVWSKIELLKPSDISPWDALIKNLGLKEHNFKASKPVARIDFIKIIMSVLVIIFAACLGMTAKISIYSIICTIYIVFILPLVIPYLTGNRFAYRIYQIFFGKHLNVRSIDEFSTRNLLLAKEEFENIKYPDKKEVDQKFAELTEKVKYLESRKKLYESLDNIRLERLSQLNSEDRNDYKNRKAIESKIFHTRVFIEGEIRGALLYLSKTKKMFDSYSNNIDPEFIKVVKRYLQANKDHDAINKEYGGWGLIASIFIMLIIWLVRAGMNITIVD